MDMIKIAMLGIAGVLLGIFVKQHRGEYSVYISLATGICILVFAVNRPSILLQAVDRIRGFIEIDGSYVSALVKMIGITYIAEFAAALCLDAGYKSIADQIQLFGKLSILAVSMPVLLSLLETVEGFW